MGSFNSFNDHLLDATYVCALARQECPDVPLFLYGESLGALVVLQLMRKPWLRDVVQGLALVATPSCSLPDAVKPYSHSLLLGLLSWWAPQMRVRSRALAAWLKTFEPAYLAATATSVSAKDPLSHPMLPSMRLASQLLLTVADLDKHLEEISVPFLALHPEASEPGAQGGRAAAAADLLGLQGWSRASGSEALFLRARSADKACRTFQALPAGKLAVIQQIGEWVSARLPSSGSGSGSGSGGLVSPTGAGAAGAEKRQRQEGDECR